MKILLCVTGSIAAYKSPEILRLLKKGGCKVKVAMTKSAIEFITPLTFQALTGENPHIEPFTTEDPMPHITLAKWADKILIAPSTTSMIGKLANAIGDDLVSTLCLASGKPIYIVPAMNKQMWMNDVNQKNVQKLKSLGYQFIGPIAGQQACGDEGVGAMASPEEIVRILTHKPRKGKVVITAGPTQEPIDPVRYISNHSSGKMGYAIAEVFEQDGYEVHLITGPTYISKPNLSKIINVRTAEEMYEAVMDNIKNAKVFIAVAAVADYRPEKYQINKIKKNASNLELRLAKNQDILAKVGKMKDKPYIIGFAAETENLIENARKKLYSKNCDLVVANLISEDNQVFGSNINQVVIVDSQSEEKLDVSSKKEIAINLLNRVNKNV
jgi:phosphopantothenoylcysteine decarboxylase/phosphopantothenate--cysteine ligase